MAPSLTPLCPSLRVRTEGKTIMPTARRKGFDLKTTKSARAIVLAVGLVGLAITARAGKPLPVVPVVSTIDGSGILADATVPNSRWQSDLVGDYTNGVDGVVSRLQGGGIGTGAGDWELDTSGSSVRAIVVDLREPVDASAVPPFAYAAVHARYISKCHQVTPASIGGMKGLNSILNCPVIFAFKWGGDTYRLIMDRATFPETNDLKVTCSEVSGNASDPNAPCVAWTMEPSMSDSGGARNVARLSRQFTVKGKTQSEDRGRFYIRFHISFRK